MIILTAWTLVTVFHAISWYLGKPATWSSVFWLSLGLLNELIADYSELPI